MSEDGVFEKLRKIYNVFGNIADGIEYVREVIEFLDNEKETFIDYIRFSRGITKHIIRVVVPYWSECLSWYYFDVMTISRDESITVNKILEEIRRKQTEIISVLLEGFRKFLEDIVESGEQDC